MASTASWTAIEQIIRQRLLTFNPPAGGGTLAARLGTTASGSGSDGKLFMDQAPDNLTGLWAILRAIDTPIDGFDGGNLVRATYELIIYARGRSQASAVKGCAVVVQQAWKYYTYTEVNGVFIADRITNAFLLPYVEPVDRELVAFRMLLPFRVAPSFLLSVTSAA